MARSHHGFVPHIPTSGFTMIEVMVVILIIGIIINFAVISLDVNNPSDELKTEARRLSSLIELAAEEALLRSELIGIDIDEKSYEFMSRGETNWELIQTAVFRKRSLPENMYLKLLTEQPIDESNQTESHQPDIVLLTSGEMTPFEITISSDLSEDYYRLSGAETGALVLDYVDQY